ncbi:MAG: L,D-transpeptidase family protein [Litorimonas sp.]
MTRHFTVLLSFLVLIASFGSSIIPTSADEPGFQQALDRFDIPLQIPDERKFILVNVPAFEVLAFQDGAPVLRSRIIVGAPWTRTPLVRTFVSAVRFRPTWRPTRSMIASGEYRDYVRPPGPDNPLGLAAVRLAPGLLVYLHGTNHPELFELERRALSHGCIRVDRWDELVAFVLDMDLETVHTYANGNRTFDISVHPIPVELGYYLSFPDPDGRLIHHMDIYGIKG